MMRFVQAISVHGKVASSAQHHLPRLPCPIFHVTADRHLRVITRVGPHQKVHIQVGASGPLAVIKRLMIVKTDAMSGMIIRIRPGGHHPRHRLLQVSREQCCR